jgi:predicted phosphodiesterase
VQSKRPRPAGVASLAQNIYVIVGDMHLPAVTDLPAQTSADPEQQELKGKRVGRVRQRDMGKSDDQMSDSDATYWHQCYIKGEIFQKAGQDLSLFAGQLRKAQGNVDASLWLLQLGDMFDLWLGFDRFFNADPPFLSMRAGRTGNVIVDDDPPKKATATDVSNTPTTPRSFVETWVNRTMYQTTESDHVREFLQFPLSHSKFLYGNHDNYLAKVVPSDLAKLRGSTYAKDHKEKGVLYACHGHQFDSSNRDGALFGVAATQTAFWGGTFIRSLEPDSRADTFKGAATLLWKKMEDFAIFAMGHTHCPLLVEVQIVMDPEPPPDDSPSYTD